ncbi:nucleotidyltransferase substrate binding protein [Aureibacillus halotolerans]|uniref:Nucleotidyltransferase substrate binding protein (TIGR01987 family) n=1 Tax=Aureibacillus halotolerans TaxID=1508390 RepID=A0A4R6U7R2_9BACI|nr:nucleotidyltransferase substrate binding protein [Aureibacillus halotolerans]TDQ40789.1 nucleotidyltransferase substrate binding protein (TIGR01987 family) [Aureibacillus halotolerans]
MTPEKDIRWKQRFENFEKSYRLLDKYAQTSLDSELERAGVIQFFEMTIELAWKVLKDYLEAEGQLVKSPRETIKQAIQNDVISNGHVWLDALARRNLSIHMYDEEKSKELIKTIRESYVPLFNNLYERLKKE